jgi:exopolysaccharide biosynthesis polyprenyl glycosylphosphotransferase
VLKQHPSLIKQAIAATDCLLITAAFGAAYQVVSRMVPTEPLRFYWIMWVGFLFFYLYFAWNNALFSVLQFSWMENLPARVVTLFASVGILGAAVLYLMPDDYHGRRLYLVFAGLAFLAVGLEKLLLRALFIALRRHGRNTTSVVLFGRGRILSGVAKQLQTHPQWGLRVQRRVDISTPVAEFETLLAESHTEEVIFCVPRRRSATRFTIDPYLRVCEDMGRNARVFLNISETTRLARWQYQPYLGCRTMVSHTAEFDPDQLLCKRLMDIAGGLAGVAVLVSTFPFCALAIKLSSRGPVFFRQERVGRNGKRFVIYKYRSMVPGAEGQQHELAQRNELQGAVFKIRDDPRVTRIGRFLRRYSLDELPQFVNVLRGDMSLVGTRPPTPDEVERYQGWHHRRISIKPGLTGLWQVSGRNRITDFDEIVRLDLKYIDSWSLWLDLRLLLRTVIAVFRREEAY